MVLSKWWNKSAKTVFCYVLYAAALMLYAHHINHKHNAACKNTLPEISSRTLERPLPIWYMIRVCSKCSRDWWKERLKAYAHIQLSVSSRSSWQLEMKKNFYSSRQDTKTRTSLAVFVRRWQVRLQGPYRNETEYSNSEVRTDYVINYLRQHLIFLTTNWLIESICSNLLSGMYYLLYWEVIHSDCGN